MLSMPEIVIRLLLAAALGAVIGFDRERHTWVAGLRTHMLVCLGAALAMIVSAYSFSGILGHSNVILDPSRIAAQVISGIGFLGAGTIMFMQRQNVIRGLTTAAGLWTVAAIGLAAGGGMYFAAVAATAIAWIVLAALKPLERRFALGRVLPKLSVGFGGHASLAAIEKVIGNCGLRASSLVNRHIPDDGDEVSIEFPRDVARQQLVEMADELREVPGVERVSLDDSARG